MNEIMTGSVDTRSVVSKMTLALLEDSGWYEANYSMADRLDWGRNQGTDFVTSPCDQWKGAYHCNTTQFSGCTYNREAEGYCPIVSYNGDLPQWARYFPQANKGAWFFDFVISSFDGLISILHSLFIVAHIHVGITNLFYFRVQDICSAAVIISDIAWFFRLYMVVESIVGPSSI